MAAQMDKDGFGTKGFPSEEDRVNCPFYFKIGSCRNGDRCNRIHTKPTRSNTILIPHMYPATPESMSVSNDEDWDDETYAKQQEHFESFFHEVWLELANYGEIEDMVVLDNCSEHMMGHVYCKYLKEDDAVKAHDGCVNRFYGARLLQPEYSPVRDLKESKCKSFHETRCVRGGMCNFMHVKHTPRGLKRKVVREMYAEHPEFNGRGNVQPSKESESGPPKAKKQRQSSEERRSMIAEWNKEAAREAGAGQGLRLPPPPVTLLPGIQIPVGNMLAAPPPPPM